jgi:ribose-phosphate pyrophosphokinase
METRLGSALVDKFRNDECRIEIKENVRGAEVFVFQSICRAPNGQTVNDSLMELLLMIDALSRASAYRISAVVPYYGYAKQDKKTKGREPISAKLVANLIEKAGAKRLVTLDLHAAQIQGFFDLPVDNLEAAPTLCSYLKAQGSKATGSSSSRPMPAACARREVREAAAQRRLRSSSSAAPSPTSPR